MKPSSAAASASIKAKKIDAAATALPLLPKQEKFPSLPSAPSPATNAHVSATEAGEGEDAHLNGQEAATEAGEEEEDEGNPLLHSVTRLRGLSFALSDFTRCFRNMEKHLKSIQKSIREKSQELDSLQPQPPPQQIQEAPRQQRREDEDRLKSVKKFTRDKSQELDSSQPHPPPQQIQEAPLQQPQEEPRQQRREDEDRLKSIKKSTRDKSRELDSSQPQPQPQPPPPQIQEAPLQQPQEERRQQGREDEDRLKSIKKYTRGKSRELNSSQPQPPPQQIQEAPLQQQQEEPRQQRREDEDRLKSIEKSTRDESQELDSLQAQPPEQIQEAPRQQPQEDPPPPAPAAAGPATRSSRDVRRICSTMGSQALKRYIAARMSSDMGALRDEVSEALKSAPDPARLVYDCILRFGRFYLEGTKVYSGPATFARNLTIVLLDFFIHSGCSKVAPVVRREVEKAAVAWRRRTVNEGWINNARSKDALGLLLLVAAFGIPAEFGIGDLCELIQVSNIQEKAAVLCRSPLFLGKFEGIIQGLVDNGSHLAAVNLSCALGLEDKFSPKSLLSSFLTETYGTVKNVRRAGQGSSEMQKEACEKQLAALKSVIKCLDDNKLDSVIRDGWNINEKITELENELSCYVPKRKSLEGGSLESRTQVKRHQPTTVIASPQPPSVTGPQEQQLHELPAKIMSNDGGPRASLNGLPSAIQSNGSSVGLFWTGSAHGSVAGTSAAPAAGAGLSTALGAVPGTGSAPSGNGPSIGSGMGLHWTGNSHGSVAGTSAAPAAGAGLSTALGAVPRTGSAPSGNGPSIGSGMGLHWTGNAHRSVVGTSAAPVAGAGLSTALGAVPRTGSATSGNGPSTGSAMGLHWTGNAHGSVARTSAAPAAGAGLSTALGAVPGTSSAPSGNGPSIGSGMGLHWTGNTLGAVAGTSYGPAVGAGLSTPSGAGPFMGSGNEMHTGTGAGSLANNWVGLNGWQVNGAYGNSVGQMPMFGLPPLAGQLPAGPPSRMVESFPGSLQRDSRSNIFGFVDTVLQSGYSHHTSSRMDNSAPAAPSAYRPSYY